MTLTLTADGQTFDTGISNNCAHAFTFSGDFGGGTLTLLDSDDVPLTEDEFTAPSRRGVYVSDDTRTISYNLTGSTSPNLVIKRKRIGTPNQA